MTFVEVVFTFLRGDLFAASRQFVYACEWRYFVYGYKEVYIYSFCRRN